MRNHGISPWQTDDSLKVSGFHVNMNLPEFSPADRVPKSARPGLFGRFDPWAERGRFGMTRSHHPRPDDLVISETTPHRPSPSIWRWCRAPPLPVSGCRPGPGEPDPSRPMISPTQTKPRRRPRSMPSERGPVASGHRRSIPLCLWRPGHLDRSPEDACRTHHTSPPTPPVGASAYSADGGAKGDMCVPVHVE